MVKRAPVDVTFAGTVHPGNYLVLVGGDVAVVEEAYAAGIESGRTALLDQIFLPAVHPDIVIALRGKRGKVEGDTLGIVETRTAVSTVRAADRGLKGAHVRLVEIKLADRLGGKAYCIFSGTLSDVEAAIDHAVGDMTVDGSLVAKVVIPQFHEEMLTNLEASTEFSNNIIGGSS